MYDFRKFFFVGFLLGLVFFFSRGVYATNTHELPIQVCDEGEHVGNPNCDVTPTITPTPTVYQCEEDCDEVTPTPSPTPILTVTPTPTPESTQSGTQGQAPTFAGSSTEAPQCSSSNTTKEAANPHVYRKGDQAIVKWLPTDGNKVNIYYKDNSASDWQYSVTTENTGYYVINGLGTRDITFAIQQVNDCSGGTVSNISNPIVDGNVSGWVLFR